MHANTPAQLKAIAGPPPESEPDARDGSGRNGDRARKVRAIEERFYGRVGRVIIIGEGAIPAGTRTRSFLVEAHNEAVETIDDKAQSTIRHARIPKTSREEFWKRVADLADEFSTVDRSGDVVYGFVAAVYPTDQPTLPAAQPASNFADSAAGLADPTAGPTSEHGRT